MPKAAPLSPSWQDFVLEHGFRARLSELSAVVAQSESAIAKLRCSGACRQLPKGKRFPELFALWHGRAPTEDEWPAPGKFGLAGTYEWQAPEIALLASLVGSLGVKDIASILTERLRQLTGDRTAVRSTSAVQLKINKIGLQSTDVVGGVTVADAGKEIGSRSTIQNAIREGQLPTRRVGRLQVISHEAWADWKAQRVDPPAGFVRLSSLKEVLAIQSDKLSEFARMGYIPSAVRCHTFGTGKSSTKFGTWYVDAGVAKQLVADRQAGRAMPWHGKPILENLQASYRRWQKRKHPAACATCSQVWGEAGAPESFEDFARQYSPLAHGAKRHLTRPWDPGLTIPAVAKMAGCPDSRVRRAIKNAVLIATQHGKRQYVSRTEATRWKTRKCPTGESERSWISLETASKQYLFTIREIRKHIRDGKLKPKPGTEGRCAAETYIPKHQCAKLREALGFTEVEAARRVGVTVPRFRILLEGVNWRGGDGIPLDTVQAVIKRLNSRAGYTIEEAAEVTGETEQWIRARIRDGTIKVFQAKWDRRRTYISEPMLQRLLAVQPSPPKREKFGEDWLHLSRAAHEAGVSPSTLSSWAKCGELKRRKSKSGWRYHRKAVRARARKYWQTVRFHRAEPPDWL